MKRTTLLLVFLAAALLFVWGCERNVTNEVVNEVAASNCFGCHNDVDGKLQQAEGEWNNSTHASGLSIDYTNRVPPNDCVKCHDHQGFVDYITTGVINPPYENVSAIHCFTCHAPHTSGNLELRTEAPVALANAVVFDAGVSNLCANCHHSRDKFTTFTLPYTLPSRWGPHHSNQSDMIRGTGGYQYTGYTYATDPHYTEVDNACIGCHMGNPAIHAGYQLGGHSFNMREEEDPTVTLAPQCTPCHAKITTDFNVNIDSVDYNGDDVIEGYQSELDSLVADLRARLIAGNLLNGTTNQSKKDRIVASADSLGALWNWYWVTEDQSRGMHNWDYTIGLVKSSINFLATGNPNNPPGGAPRKPEEMAISAH
jgi:hypothetical protein